MQAVESRQTRSLTISFPEATCLLVSADTWALETRLGLVLLKDNKLLLRMFSRGMSADSVEERETNFRVISASTDLEMFAGSNC